MQTTLQIKVGDLTAEYAAGLVQLFSAGATLDITVNYESEVKNTSAAKSSSPAAPTGKKRGRKPKVVDPAA